MINDKLFPRRMDTDPEPQSLMKIMNYGVNMVGYAQNYVIIVILVTVPMYIDISNILDLGNVRLLSHYFPIFIKYFLLI